MKEKLKALTYKDIIKLAEELKQSSHADDSIVREICPKDAILTTSLIELHFLLVHELADRLIKASTIVVPDDDEIEAEAESMCQNAFEEIDFTEGAKWATERIIKLNLNK